MDAAGGLGCGLFFMAYCPVLFKKPRTYWWLGQFVFLVDLMCSCWSAAEMLPLILCPLVPVSDGFLQLLVVELNNVV